MMRTFVVLVTFVSALFPIAADAVTITVCPAGCDETSVKLAVDHASPGDTVLISSGTYTESSDIDVNKSLTVQGSGIGSTMVQMTGAFPVFSVSSTAPHGLVVLSDMTITGADNPSTDGGGIWISTGGSVEVSSCEISGNTAKRGGGIFVDHTGIPLDLTLDSVTIEGNQAILDGGGIYSEAGGTSITIDSSSISQNTSGSEGGGVFFAGLLSSTLDITNTELDNNTCTDYGAGICITAGVVTIGTSVLSNNTGAFVGGGFYASGGNTTISRSLIAGNTSDLGGGFYLNSNAEVYIDNSTITVNTALLGDAGGIHNSGILGLSFSTIAFNTSSTGYAMGIRNNSSAATLTANIISNPGGNNCGGLYDSNGFNLDDDDTCGLVGPGDIGGQPIGLGPSVDLGDHRSHFSLLPDSIAIDHADVAVIPPTDQRGLSRPLDGDGDGPAVCDSGAIEHIPVLFADGFESGDTLQWSATSP